MGELGSRTSKEGVLMACLIGWAMYGLLAIATLVLMVKTVGWKMTGVILVLLASLVVWAYGAATLTMNCGG